MRAVVTGATGGIGEAIARRLAQQDMTVVLVGRSDERLEAARDRIAATVPGAGLVLERADLAEQAEVRDLARRLAAAPHPDIVISNAALIAPPDRLTAAGLPRVLAVNHLAPYVLLRTLAAVLDRARFIIVGADPKGLARRPVDLDDLRFADSGRLGDDVELRPFAAYGETKNMNAMFAFELARRLSSTAITVNAAHPGIIGGTGLSGETPGLREAVARAYQLDRSDLPDSDAGADTPAWLATSAQVKDVSGTFFVDRQAVATAPHTTDPARGQQLWNHSARLTGLPV
jgi:NAD(P)-dependent dehydrogenase (short-subunit alcohol dehydrogenase family)